MAFKVGDVVWIKSGGAAMTVALLGEDGKVFTRWHNRTSEGFKEERGDGYRPDMLTSTNPNEPETMKVAWADNPTHRPVA